MADSMLDMTSTMSSGVDSLSVAGDSTNSVAPISFATVPTLSAYLSRMVPALLEDNQPNAFNKLLEESNTKEKLKRFITDPQTKVLLIQRYLLKEDEEDATSENSNELEEQVVYSVVDEVVFGNPKITSIVLIKKSSHIEADKLIYNQICEMILNDSNPYGTLHSYISSAVSPYFKSYVKETRRAERDFGDKMSTTVEKKIAELEMGLLHLQQNIDIPEITLQIHPIVLSVMKKCQQENRKATVADFGDRVEDSVFLNQLQTGVGRWIREIQKVTKLDRDPSSGTALQEISFWLNLDRALSRIQEKRDSPEVALTLDILKKGKRFHATVSFDADTRLKEAIETVNDFNPLMKDFPLNDLLSATELDKIRLALQAIFQHLKKIRNTKYPIKRALKLMEAISRDLMTQLLKVLATRRMMHISFEEFEKVTNAACDVFTTWDDEYDKLQGLMRDIIKKKKSEHLKMVWRINLAHKKLHQRIDQMKKFRRQHEQLRSVIVRVLRPVIISTNQRKIKQQENDLESSGIESLNSAATEETADISAIDQINLAYELVKEVDALDISKEGSDVWDAANKRYEERIDRVEAKITAKLRDQLGTAKNANEMFRIFSRFNALFIRPHIRGAIREYQTQLIQRVKDDIEALQEKFKIQYAASKACKMSKFKDIPPVAGNIIWAKQIERQLNVYMKRVESILGREWENHVDGQRLKEDAKNFRKKLETNSLYEQWSSNVQTKQMNVSGRIFNVENNRTSKGNVLKLRVNFLPEIITLAKEVRNLKNLSYRIALGIVNKAHQANQLYPFAISLIETVKSYETTCEKVDDCPSVSLLVAGLKKEVQVLLCEGVSLVWESYKMDQFVQRLAEKVLSFQEKVDELLIINELIELEVKSLDSCSYSSTVFSEILNKIQRAVDDLSLHSYSNLNEWVDKLDEQVEKKLAYRLSAGIKSWTQALHGKEENELDVIPDTETPQSPVHRAGGDPKIQSLVHEIRITNQVMYVNPSVEEARFNLLQQLFAWENVILTLNRIESTRYQVGLDRPVAQQYRNLLKLMPDSTQVLESAYETIDNKVKKMQEYIFQWLTYQSLWDLQPDMLYVKLGENVSKWINTLVEIKKSRATFDTTDTRKEIGPLIVDYAKVQSKVTLKYDSWHKEVLSKFGILLGNEMCTLHTIISKSRLELEQQSIDTANTKEAVTFITYVQTLKTKTRQWEKQVELYKEGQRILERQRFQFPNNWLHVDNIEGEWSAFNEIMRRKDSQIQTQVASLQVKIVAQDKSVENDTVELLAEWEKEKPVDGYLSPKEATDKLQHFGSKFSKIKEDRDNVHKAKEALELLAPGISPFNPNDEKLSVALEELEDLKSVWSELCKIWEQLDQLKELPWLSVQPRKVRNKLDNILSQLKELPARFRQYPSYDFVKRQIQGLAKVNVLIIELKSDALKERHWKVLTKQLNVQWILSELTLGNIWDIDLQRNESIFKNVIITAQGEMALEEFLKQVREAWQNYELDLIPYQNKCRLIKSFDDLFDKAKEHINSISAMKLSPYFKEFEEEATSWEKKLNYINALFDVWIDVQRRWVYLDGIFSGSGDIQNLLPIETSRFQSISSEFLVLMKKVAKSPLVTDVLNIQGVQRSLERLADLLGKIQKALGEYLERERSSFPRFYFVGDEDLLEIIGNSKNVERLQKHFKKMFAGVASIILNEDTTEVLGLVSKEGEEVRFYNRVSIKDNPKINEWLTLVESEMRMTLAQILSKAVVSISAFKSGKIDKEEYIKWLDSYQAQIIILAFQISWSESVEQALNQMQTKQDGDMKSLEEILENIESTLEVLADFVLEEQPPIRRKKLEHLITEFVHKRDYTRFLIKNKVNSPKSFHWLLQMRFYYDPRQTDILQQLSIQMANAKFNYGFEYLGVSEKLVQTPLTDRCYLSMTQALNSKLGSSSFGPAGTGKTESVKALGHQLGRFVLVFNCDETFDFQAVSRILIGLSVLGAFGCFDEFNRLEERILSAVSQQIQMIQETLKDSAKNGLTVELAGKQVKINPDMAIFITMNPGYAGRSLLPDNLKKLFRSMAMTQPDRQLISQVMLFSQGFRSAEKLASKIVPFFKLCAEQLSNCTHYDFGLRALKNVLVSAGNIKRDRILKIKGESVNVDETKIAEHLPEQEILIQSICETISPKLIAEDIPLLFSLLTDVFPNVPYNRAQMDELKKHIADICKEYHLVYNDESKNESNNLWVEKILQLYQISNINHGIMMVGPSGSGKSTAWRVLLRALERFDGVEGVAHVIDPKAISKENLYGVLDPNTREWTDGLFSSILRKINDNIRGESSKRQWIIFDGDVDPVWIEAMNSLLDDNRLLSLPNGERLALANNVRIMFEVQDLKYATLASVSRCGMVFFSSAVVSTDMLFQNYFMKLHNISLDDNDEEYMNLKQYSSIKNKKPNDTESQSDTISSSLQTQIDCLNALLPHFSSDGLVQEALKFAMEQEHVMDFTKLRALVSLFSLLNQCIRNVINYNKSNSINMDSEQLEKYMSKSLIHSILWAFVGDSKLSVRQNLGDFIRSFTTIPLPGGAGVSIIDYEVTISGEWSPWSAKVPKIEVETHKVAAPDVVIPTLDTVRHESLLITWLAEHNPVVLVGGPGAGKTMTLFNSLRSLPDMEVVGLNFSSATTPELLLKTFDHYCEYRKTPNGLILSPIQLGKWLILFCDEINLPDMDKYGTMRVISFLRQMVEHGGFYRTSDQQWVKLERIQFVGACNLPTDPGRKPLSHRFLRHVPIIYVDYPGEVSLKQIYGTFNRAMLRILPPLRAYAEPLTSAMVEFYLLSQERFTQDMQPHYIYSPRELTRWVRGICEAIRPLENLSVEGLVRLWAHEALRLFQDRLIEEEERIWTDENINQIALKHFPNIDSQTALERPILYSNWLTKDYVPVDRETLREFTKARLKVFYEEELDVALVLFNEVLDHVLRIDRIFRQPQGHLLLIGVSGSGKTTLSRFVAWMNGLSIFQIKVHNKYTANNFDDDLRSVLRRAGCKSEKIAFILDESNVLDTSFLERMNTLLANGEVPGLFEGDEFTTLMTQCKESSQRDGLMLDSNEELYKWFTQQVIKNLHVVFTMNPSSEGLKDRAATSPALFNRCVLNWFGDWSDEALYHVGKEFTAKLDIDRLNYQVPDYFPVAFENVPANPSHREAIVNAFVYVHQTLHLANKRLIKREGRATTITPRHYLDFINHYVKLFHEKCSELEDEQLHLNVGLSKIRETVEQVEELQKSLASKSAELELKNQAANSKLKEMLKDQQEAEKKKVQSQEIQAQLKEQESIIAVKKKSVMADLSQVEPAVKEAQQAVQSIKKQNLVEVKSMSNPPPPVKMALESICLLLGEQTTDWKVIRSVLMRDNFIHTIVNFQTDNITDDIRQKMKSKYLDNPDYNFEKVNRASLACAQLNFADMLKRIEPLRNELKSLESEANVNIKKAAETDSVIAHLEKSIASYKEEYANLVSEAQAIKTDLVNVQSKVDRSIALLHSLSSEKGRWEQSSETFKYQMQTIAGDVLLSAAFIAYAGYFDQHYRNNLFNSWCTHLQRANILFRQDLARTEYLSTADERLKWQASSLPSDDLCVENAIMLKRFNRYPLIIDPSGQATKFLCKIYEDRRITKTSFLDDSFRKNLESALRFGNPLLVQDVESYDPILNPVLNREVKKTGGRVLISLGDQEIDLSPAFCIFFSTRDPTVDFPADLCSRVTFVNFTVTRSSLQSQCLNQVLKAERPDIDEKRSDLLKLQGEFHVKLRQLEKSLLQALNDSKGKILDDDNVISTLEKLKNEAAEISRKVEETDKVMAEVDSVSQQYMPLSQACSSIFFTLEALHQVHFLYQYSLQFFLDIYNDVLLNNSHLNSITEPNMRLNTITNDLFETCYNRVSRGMLHDDWIIFALLLCKIHLKGFAAEPNFEFEFDYFLKGGKNNLVANSSATSLIKIDFLNHEQCENITSLSKINGFKSIEKFICSNKDKFKEWLENSAPEDNVPKLWDEDRLLTEIGQTMQQLLIIQAFRADRVLSMSQKIVEKVFSSSFLHAGEIDMAHIVEKEVKASSPILMCSVPGYDASGRVDDLAAELDKALISIAIGSSEGFSQAEKAINSAAKSGNKWVVLKNVHLAPQWLIQLEKKLHTLQPHPSFRLFLTLEIHPKIPVNLLRAGRTFVFEPPPGIKANLLRTFNTIPASRMMKEPHERSKLYFILSWFHAIVQERLRYCPLGWSKKYEFNESDLRVACDTLDTWVDSVALGRTNLPPEKVPWNALCTLLGQCIYGGKIDNIFDHRLLVSFLEKLFTPKSFESDFILVDLEKTAKPITMPDGIRRDQFLHWVNQLPERQTPSWLGLPDSAEKVLLTNQGAVMVSKLLKLQLLEDDDDEIVYVNKLDEKKKRSSSKDLSDGRPSWMRNLLSSAESWKNLLPSNLQLLKRTVDNIKDPLFRCYEREISSTSKLLNIVLQDLKDVILICKAEKKQTNYHRQMISDLAKGVIPTTWKLYIVPQATTVIQWVTDFAERVKQLSEISNLYSSTKETTALQNINVWLGGLINPEAYITATRQYVAQMNGWSLEELVLEVNIQDSLNGSNSNKNDYCFGVTGLKLQGAITKNNKLYPSSIMMTDLELTNLKWIKKNESKASEHKVTLPVYLNSNRSELLFTVDLEIGENENKSRFYEGGVAFIASGLN